MKKLAVAGLVAVICAPMTLSAQSTRDRRGLGSQYTLTSWTEKDGLATVWSVAQDQQGVVWLGTVAGLVRFDGARFLQWTPPPESARLSTTFVRALCAARDGSLWVAFGGPTLIGRMHGSEFVEYALPQGLQLTTVVVLMEGRDGTIWAGGRGGLARLRSQKWEVVPGPLTEPIAPLEPCLKTAPTTYGLVRPADCFGVPPTVR